MRIKFLNLKEQYRENKHLYDRAFRDIASGGQYFAHNEVEQLERTISRRYGKSPVVATNSGTTALTALLLSLKLPAGSLVAMPTWTYPATANAIIAAGYVPYFTDVFKHCSMQPSSLNYAINDVKIAAVVYVTLNGHAGWIDSIVDICDKNDLPLIIDAAQDLRVDEIQPDSVPLSYHCVFSYKHAVGFALSFNPLKNIGSMGAGGAAVCLCKDRASDVRMMIHQGKDAATGNFVLPGINGRMNALDAAVVNIKMQKALEIRQFKLMVQSRIMNFHYRGFTVLESGNPYVISLLANSVDTAKKLHHHLVHTMKIEVGCHYKMPCHMMPAYNSKQILLTAESMAGRQISLPSHTSLTADNIAYMVDSLLMFEP